MNFQSTVFSSSQATDSFTCNANSFVISLNVHRTQINMHGPHDMWVFAYLLTSITTIIYSLIIDLNEISMPSTDCALDTLAMSYFFVSKNIKALFNANFGLKCYFYS